MLDRRGGGDGNDRVDGQAGNNFLDETKLGGNGNDHLFGATGNDRVHTQGNTRDRVDRGGAGHEFAPLDTRDRQKRCDDVRRVKPSVRQTQRASARPRPKSGTTTPSRMRIPYETSSSSIALSDALVRLIVSRSCCRGSCDVCWPSPSNLPSAWRLAAPRRIRRATCHESATISSRST